jgi:hypothetical protein
VEHLNGRHSTLGLASKYPTRVEMTSNNKHTNVQNWSVDYKEKKFYGTNPGYKAFFSSSLMQGRIAQQYI